MSTSSFTSLENAGQMGSLKRERQPKTIYFLVPLTLVHTRTCTYAQTLEAVSIELSESVRNRCGSSLDHLKRENEA